MTMYGGVEVQFNEFLTSALHGDGWSASAAFSPRKAAPGTHWMGGLVDPRDSLKALKNRNLLPQWESSPDSSVFQTVPHPYISKAIPAPNA
jgi:hypothetical protein